MQLIDIAPWLVSKKDRQKYNQLLEAQREKTKEYRQQAVVSDMQKLAQMMDENPNWSIQTHGS